VAKAHTLTDNFNDNATDAAKWRAYGNPAPLSERVREVNGRVEIRPRSNHTAVHSGYVSLSHYDLTDSHVHIELVQPLRPAEGAETTFSVDIDGINALLFSIEAGNLKCLALTAGTWTLLKQVPYDPVRHRWLRLREGLGRIYWEISRDGAVWGILAGTPDPAALKTVTIRFQGGLHESVSSPGVAIFDNFNVVDTTRPQQVDERRRSAREIRVEAADLAAARPHPVHVSNNDEINYPDQPFIGNYSKGLAHDNLGNPDPLAYGTLLRAIQSQDPADLEKIRFGSAGASRLVSPQAGLAFEIGGPDAQELTLPPAPRFDSEQTAHEMGELYWMALLRDVPFSAWYRQEPGTGVPQAIESLNRELTAYGGPFPVTSQNLFRGIYSGEQTGPYVSQFLLRGNVDARTADGLGRCACEGIISYGAQVIDQRILAAQSGVDYLTRFRAWLDVQNGADKRGLDFFAPERRFISTLRAGATYVHFDQVLNAFYNAAWILLSEPTGVPIDAKRQSAFGSLGSIHVFQVLGEVLGRAFRAAWWQKWGVHRRLRPEEFGGRVHHHLTGAREYPIHSSLLTSLRSGLLASTYGSRLRRFPTFLLPQAYPEGAPAHPSYGSGHATAAAACATVLKAFFDEAAPIEHPVEASSDGSLLQVYTGADASEVTVGGELNKLAGNLAAFRQAAGVQFRSDATESCLLGEAVAIRLLQEMSLGFHEHDTFFELTRLDGQKIHIFDGVVAGMG
jgi:membrane-associated phospholipid phosphatase